MSKWVTPAPVSLSVAVGVVQVTEELQRPTALEIVESLQTSVISQRDEAGRTTEERAACYHLLSELGRLHNLVVAANSMSEREPQWKARQSSRPTAEKTATRC